MMEKRKAPRVMLNRRAALVRGRMSYACLVQNMSDRGLYVVCGNMFRPGDVLTFYWEMRDGDAVEATVQVKHADKFGIGVEIRQMSDRSMASYSRLLEGMHAAPSGQLGKPRAVA
ncbi:MAG: PilZ domain-containing protein [Rhodospirillaceae bacterium]